MNHEPVGESFQPTASVTRLKLRAEVLRRIRTFFEEREFLEVETPLLSQDTVVDRYLHPIPVDKAAVTDQWKSEEPPFWLQTSPEFAMKRILAAHGSQVARIFQICKAFRCGEAGEQHNPEFTMLEWYAVGEDYEQGMQRLASFAQAMLGSERIDWLTYREAFLTYAGLDPLKATLEQLRTGASIEGQDRIGGAEESRDDLLNRILCEQVEPQLGIQNPVILHDYPATQAALAKVRAGDIPVAERFELYVAGVELANGYHELTDPDELLARNREVNRQRRLDGRRELPEQSQLLAAMRAGLPACSGVALGIDRLVMLLAGARRISDVIAFPLTRA